MEVDHHAIDLMAGEIANKVDLIIAEG